MKIKLAYLPGEEREAALIERFARRLCDADVMKLYPRPAFWQTAAYSPIAEEILSRDKS